MLANSGSKTTDGADIDGQNNACSLSQFVNECHITDNIRNHVSSSSDDPGIRKETCKHTGKNEEKKKKKPSVHLNTELNNTITTIKNEMMLKTSSGYLSECSEDGTTACSAFCMCDVNRF